MAYSYLLYLGTRRESHFPSQKPVASIRQPQRWLLLTMRKFRMARRSVSKSYTPSSSRNSSRRVLLFAIWHFIYLLAAGFFRQGLVRQLTLIRAIVI